MLLAKK